MPQPSSGSCCRTHDGSPGASCTFCMRLWDWKGVRVGECKVGCFHLLIFLPESSANTPATRHPAPKLVEGGLRERTLVPWLLSWPRLGREGQDAGPLLGRDWAGALTLCPQTVVWVPSPCWLGRAKTEAYTGAPLCHGACAWDQVVWVGRLRLERDGQPVEATENQKD